ncbi:MAG: MATE family efflux transporter [Hydrotalea sp.]|nr:MATE family efflux transporter [Hydrotalea sp.]
MTIESFWRETLKDSKKLTALAIPIILSSVTTAALAITDSYFLSRLDSPVPLAGYGLTATFLVVFYATVYGFLNPLVIMVAQAAGSKQYKKVGEVVRVGCFMAITAGSLFGLLMFACYFLLRLFGQPIEVVAGVFGYWITVSLSIGFWATGYVIKQTLDALQKPWTATLIYSSMIVVNLPLAYGFIFGVADWLPALGLAGAGIAWLMADMISNALFFLYFFLNPSMKKYHGTKNGGGAKWFLRTPLDKKIIKNFIKNSIPVAIESFFEVVSYAMLGVMVGWFGVQALAARQISNGFLEMLYMIPLSMTYATTIVIADIVGKKQFSRLRIAGGASLMIVSCLTLLSVVFLLLVGNSVATFFGAGLPLADVIIPLAAGFLVIGAVSQMVDGLQSTMLGALRGLGDFNFSSIVSIIGYMLVSLPLAYIFGFHIFHHPMGIIAGFIVGVFLVGMILAVRFWQKTNFKRA